MMMTNSLALWYVGWSHADEDNNMYHIISFGQRMEHIYDRNDSLNRHSNRKFYLSSSHAHRKLNLIMMQLGEHGSRNHFRFFMMMNAVVLKLFA